MMSALQMRSYDPALTGKRGRPIVAGESTLMTLEEMLDQLPRLVAAMGEAWLRRNRAWVEPFIVQRLPWYQQLERDLTTLEAHVGPQKLIKCYRDSLRDKPQIQKSIFEIHGAALLATAATNVRLHVPRGNGSRKNFDLWAEIREHPINAESKTRKDEFPFNLSPESEEPAGSRETIDPHDAADLGIEAMPRTPGLSTSILPKVRSFDRLCLRAWHSSPTEDVISSSLDI